MCGCFRVWSKRFFPFFWGDRYLGNVFKDVFGVGMFKMFFFHELFIENDLNGKGEREKKKKQNGNLKKGTLCVYSISAARLREREKRRRKEKKINRDKENNDKKKGKKETNKNMYTEHIVLLCKWRS